MKKFYMRFLIIVFAFSVSMLSANAQTTRLVKNANDAGSGSLRAAVISALAGDIIRIDGTSSNFLHKGVTIITLTSGAISFATDNLVFKGFFNAEGDTVKVSGNNASGVISTTAATLITLDSMYLINGKVTSGGGGGGIAAQGTSNVDIRNSTISGNSTNRNGGGVFTTGNAIINNSTISGNTSTEANGSGGGVEAYGTATISNSTISGNRQTDAFGIAGGVSTNGISTLTNCTITGNSSSEGGGIYIFSAANITNCTIVGNTGGQSGGVVARGINITGSIVALNSGNSLYNGSTFTNGPTTNGGYNIFSDAPAGTVSSDQTGATPAQLGLGALAKNGGPTLTMLPGAGSIAMANGNPSDHTGDQRGKVWVSGTIRSVGAVNNAAVVLPIRLVSFSGSAINNHAALLNWVTATEINNKGFALLRSTDNANNFEQITFVNSLAVSGNSTGTLSYTYTDNTPSNGIIFYRLQQIDMDGNYTYSAVISVILKSQIQLQISPNPAWGTLKLQGAAAGSNYRVIDIKGHSIKEGILKNARIDVSGLSAGVYILQIKSNSGQTQTAKFVKN